MGKISAQTGGVTSDGSLVSHFIDNMEILLYYFLIQENRLFVVNGIHLFIFIIIVLLQLYDIHRQLFLLFHF